MIVSMVLAGLILSGLPVVGRRQRPTVYDEAAAYDAIAAELRRGASVRHAVAAVHPGTNLSRLALSGQPMSWVAAELVRLSQRSDGLIGAGLQLAAAGGAPAAKLFLSFAERVRAERHMAVRKRVLTAQARASALVVALLPLVAGGLLVLTRSTESISVSGAARASVLVGLAMELAGAALVMLLARRAGR